MKQAYIQREIFTEIVKHLSKPEITLITGSRQVGKTVLMEQMKEYLIEQKNVRGDAILSFNLDIIKDAELFRNQTEFIEFLKEKSAGKKMLYVFVDEAQKVQETGVFFKGVYDSKLPIKLILSGSSSFEIKAKLNETLTGRKMIFSLMPFSFSEFLRYQDGSLSNLLEKKVLPGAISLKKIIEFYKEYLVFGGYPRVVLAKGKAEKIKILEEIYTSYIEKDILSFLPVKNPIAFNKLIKLLASQAGQLVDISEIAMHIGVNRQTVENYIYFLEETFILKTIRPYFNNPRQEIVKAGKIYFLDNGIRNFALEMFASFDDRLDKGQVLESAVFIALLSECTNRISKLHFWRTKQGAEVDFLIEQENGLLPIEVKTTLQKKGITRSIGSFIEKFSPKKVFVVNLTFFDETMKVNNTAISFILPFTLL